MTLVWWLVEDQYPFNTLSNSALDEATRPSEDGVEVAAVFLGGIVFADINCAADLL